MLGVKQLISGVNKIEIDDSHYKQAPYTEVAEEMRNILCKVGWKAEFVTASVPVIPISGLLGDNLLKPSTNMPWWTGVTVKNLRNEDVKVVTLLDALNNMVSPPPREENKPVRVPISGIYKIKGVGDVLAGRVEQGVVEPNKEVVFLPTHTAANECAGKVFSLEMHHKKVEKAFPGDNVGMNIKGLRKENMPRSGDVMIYKGDKTLGPTKSFKAAVQTLDIPKEIKVGYSPIGFVRCGHSACRLTKIDWKRGKETGGAQADNPASLKTNDLAQCVFEPLHPLVVDTFKSCEGLSRIAFLDGNTAVMLGKITEVDRKE
jgi:elongation factor 1-alpha